MFNDPAREIFGDKKEYLSDIAIEQKGLIFRVAQETSHPNNIYIAFDLYRDVVQDMVMKKEDAKKVRDYLNSLNLD